MKTLHHEIANSHCMLVSKVLFFFFVERCVTTVNLLGSSVSCLCPTPGAGVTAQVGCATSSPQDIEDASEMALESAAEYHCSEQKHTAAVEESVPQLWLSHSRDTDSLGHKNWRNCLYEVLVLRTKC